MENITDPQKKNMFPVLLRDPAKRREALFDLISLTEHHYGAAQRWFFRGLLLIICAAIAGKTFGFFSSNSIGLAIAGQGIHVLLLLGTFFIVRSMLHLYWWKDADIRTKLLQVVEYLKGDE